MSRRIMDSFSEVVLSSTWYRSFRIARISPTLSPINYILTDLKTNYILNKPPLEVLQRLCWKTLENEILEINLQREQEKISKC